MENELIFAILLTVVVLGINFISYYSSKNLVLEYLISIGAKEINVIHQWLDFDKYNFTFYVSYVDVNGNRLDRSCKVPFLGGEIYWSDNIAIEGANNSSSAFQYSSFEESIRSNFSGLPHYKVSTILAVPNSEDLIVMFKYTQAFRNVLRCKPNGTVIWQAELPNNENDVYTNIQWNGGQLYAFSRSCSSILLDVNTGKILLD